IYKESTANRNAIDGERAVQMFYMAYFSLNPYYLLCPEMEFNHGYGDVFLMPEKRLDYVKHSYIVEFKYVKTDADAKDVQAKYDEAVNQLNTYSAAPQVKNMTEGTELHRLVVVFKGFDVEKMEEM
ncbi:MAG: PD-(D/E)XK nuclease domain-containing protein, partial [Bacteroidales bacterium]|nr:PD-(D/E)XK nuclease domain-containing protein [Bacteroidales bacterium]